jgi:hypothetical protein
MDNSNPTTYHCEQQQIQQTQQQTLRVYHTYITLWTAECAPVARHYIPPGFTKKFVFYLKICV